MSMCHVVVTWSYTSSKPNAVERGRELLSYLQRYLSGTLCIKKPIELVAAEMWALKRQESHVEVFHDESNLGIVRNATERLAMGLIDETVSKYMADRAREVENDRQEPSNILKIIHT